MKIKKFAKKLHLIKKTVARLGSDEMTKPKGGVSQKDCSFAFTCSCAPPVCPSFQVTC